MIGSAIEVLTKPPAFPRTEARLPKRGDCAFYAKGFTAPFAYFGAFTTLPIGVLVPQPVLASPLTPTSIGTEFCSSNTSRNYRKLLVAVLAGDLSHKAQATTLEDRMSSRIDVVNDVAEVFAIADRAECRQRVGLQSHCQFPPS